MKDSGATPPLPVRRPLPRWRGAAALLWGSGPLLRLATVYAALYVAWLLLLPKDETTKLWSAWLVLPLSGAAAWLAFRAARRADLHPGVRRGWTLLGYAFLCQFAGDLAWAVYESVLRVDPSESWANLPYLTFYAFAPLALARFPIAARGRLDRWLHALDAMAVVVGGGLVTVRFVVLPNLERFTGWPDMLPLAYPVGDLLALMGLARILLRRPVGAPARSMDLLAAGLLLNTAGNTLWAVLEATGLYETAGFADALWAVSYLVLLAAGEQARRGSLPVEGASPASGEDARPRRVLLVTSALAYGLLVVGAIGPSPHALITVSAGVILLTSLLIARERLATSERLQHLESETQRRSEALFRSLVHTSMDALVVLEPNGNVRYASPAAGALFFTTTEELLGRPLLGVLDVEQRAPFLAHLREAIDGAPTCTWECRVQGTDGEQRVLDCRLGNMLADPTVAGIVLRASDVSDRYEERAALFRKAFYDEGTGLPRRELFRDRIEQTLRSRPRGEHQVAVMFVDLDDFKDVNDRHGHAVGDEVLRAVAVRISSLVRASDTAARIGGDEFGILLGDLPSEAEVTKVAERLIASMREPIEARGRQLRLGASVGIAIASGDVGADVLLRRADRAMYEAKRRGGMRWVMHTSALVGVGGHSTDF